MLEITSFGNVLFLPKLLQVYSEGTRLDEVRHTNDRVGMCKLLLNYLVPDKIHIH